VLCSGSVKIATWNVNSVRTRLPRLLPWLERRQPDVVCLQETKVQDEHFPLAELEALGYQALVSGERTYNGVAILSRSPGAKVIRALPGDGPDAPRRLLVTSSGGARIVNVYAPNGGELGSPGYTYKLGWYRRLLAFLESEVDAGADVVVQEGGLYTWWDYRAGAFHRNRGLRIDHILLSPSLAKRCAAVEIDRNERKGARPSDHAPVVATFE